jgi:hypothetical protein
VCRSCCGCSPLVRRGGWDPRRSTRSRPVDSPCHRVRWCRLGCWPSPRPWSRVGSPTGAGSICVETSRPSQAWRPPGSRCSRWE